VKSFGTALWGLVMALAVVSGPTASRADPAEETYRLYCAQCHGIQGNGQGINQTADGLAVSPRDHTNAKEMSKLSDQELRLAIAEGGDAVQKSELMPAWGKTLLAEDIDDLVLYLRTLCTCAGRNEAMPSAVPG
jgi:cytochrome c oxidase cbb3-type subunit 3